MYFSLVCLHVHIHTYIPQGDICHSWQKNYVGTKLGLLVTCIYPLLPMTCNGHNTECILLRLVSILYAAVLNHSPACTTYPAPITEGMRLISRTALDPHKQQTHTNRRHNGIT